MPSFLVSVSACCSAKTHFRNLRPMLRSSIYLVMRRMVTGRPHNFVTTVTMVRLLLWNLCSCKADHAMGLTPDKVVLLACLSLLSFFTKFSFSPSCIPPARLSIPHVYRFDLSFCCLNFPHPTSHLFMLRH